VLEITSHFLDREHAAAWLSARGFIREPWRSSPSLVAARALENSAGRLCTARAIFSLGPKAAFPLSKDQRPSMQWLRHYFALVRAGNARRMNYN
jgi:hypothetical protein